jgi:hypothetical protein
MPIIGHLIAEASGEVRDADGTLLNQEDPEPDDEVDESEDEEQALRLLNEHGSASQ